MTRGLRVGTSDSERRETPRVPFGTWSFIETAGTQQISLTFDISLGGLGLIATRELEIGTFVDVWLILPGGVEVRCDAEVVRARENRLGVRFVGLPRAIEEFYHSLSLDAPSQPTQLPS